MPARYADYLEKARKAGDDTGFRHYWERCVILGLRDGLRGSRNHPARKQRLASGPGNGRWSVGGRRASEAAVIALTAR